MIFFLNCFIYFRNIGVIYESLRDHNERPAIFGVPNEGWTNQPYGRLKPRPIYIALLLLLCSVKKLQSKDSQDMPYDGDSNRVAKVKIIITAVESI